MLPSSAPPWGSGPPNLASYSTLATRDSTAKSAEGPTSAALHNLFTFSRRQSAECDTPSATPSSDEVAGRNIECCQCCTRLPLKGRMEEALLAPVLEKPRCTSTVVATQSTLETSHSGTDGGAVMSAHIRATSTELRTRVDDAPPMAVSDIFSCARPHLGMMAQVCSSIAISNQTSASAPPTPSNRRELSKMGRRPSSAPVFRLPSDTDLRALALVVFGVHHVKTNGWRDAPSPASLPLRQASSMVNSTDVTLVASGTHFDRSINERFNTVESDCACAAAAPRTARGTCVAGVEAVPSFHSANASANASARKDRHSSGTCACGVPSESVSLQPIGTNSFDSDGAAAESCDSEVSVTAGTSETLGALHRGDDTPVTGGRCSRVRRGRSISTPVAGELGGFAPAANGASEAAAAASNPADHHLCVESCSSGGGAGAEIEGVRCLFGRPMLSSLTSQRDGGGGGGAPAPPLGIFQSGLFLAMNEGDVPPASALEAPMTPQSFSMMLLARENGEGVLQHPVRAGSVSAVATTPTNGDRCSLPLPEGNSRMSTQSSQQVPPVVHGAETVGGGDGLRINRLEDWFVDGGSRDSHETRTTGMTLTSGVGPHSCMAAGSGSAACVLGGGYVTPLGSFQILSGSRKQEISMSAVDADDIPSTPTDISALPPPPSPLSARRQRQRRASLHPDGDNAVRRSSRVDVETGVIETDTLVRARAVSKDGARTYEIVNEKYVMYDYELGKGSYSTVRLCYNLMNGYFYAVKVLDRVRLKHRQLGSEAGLCKIDQEIAMMKQVQHKNIIALHEVIRDPSMRYVYLVMELAESREVLSMRDNGDVLPRGGNGAATAYPEAATREIVKGLLQALMYAHYLGVAHRDIKPSNVLLKSDGTVKLCDFGVSVLVGGTPLQLNREGSVAFLAPELLLSSEVDVSRFVTPVDLSLGTTRNRGAAHMLTDDSLASAARTARTTVASSATATNETQLETTGWAMSSMEEGVKWTRGVMSASVGTVSEPSARVSSSRAPVRGFSSASGGSPSGIPTWPLSGSLPLRGGGGAAARRASFRPRSPLPFGAAGDACSAGVMTASADPGIGGVTPETPPTAASSPATPAAQLLGCPSEAADQAPVDLFKADVFALGVTVYTILLGRLPWHASSAASQRAAILAEPDPFLRLYKAAYGDAYIWPPQVRDACWPPHGVLSSDSIPVSSQASRLASGNDARSANEGTENTEVRDRQQPIADEKDHGVAPAPATAFACKWRHYSSNTGTSSDDHLSEQDKCAPAAMKLADAPSSHCNAPTRSDGTSSPPVVKHSTTGTRLSDPVMQHLAMNATTSDGCPPSDRVEPQSTACGSRTAIDAPPPPTPVQQAQNLHLPQWKPFTDVILGTTPIKKATAADTAITQQPEMAVMHRRHGGGEHVDDDSRQMKARATCVRPRVSAIKTHVSRAATQPRLGLLIEVPRSGAICGDQRAAMSGPVYAPLSRQSRPTTIPSQLMPCRGAIGVDNDDGLASHPSEVVEDMNESTRESRQCIQGSSSDILQNDPSTVISTTRLYTGNVVSSGITGRSTNSGEVDNGSDDDDESSSTPHGHSGISATSSLCSDDDEDSEACESIYERLFEMEQPCRAYTVAEHMPLPPIPGVSQEISGEAVDFVRLCLRLDPAERRTVFELFRHPWIRGGERAPAVEANTSRESP